MATTKARILPGLFLLEEIMNTKMLNIISAIDGTQSKNDLIVELTDPSLEIGFKPTVIKLLNQMFEMNLIKEDHSFIYVTDKGKEFFEKSEIDNPVY